MMARDVQSQSSQPQAGLRASVGPVANAIFWVVMATSVPVQAILAPFPELAPYAKWAPILFYTLAAWSFARAARVLRQVAGGRGASRLRTGMAAPSAGKPAADAGPRTEAKRAKPNTGLPASRTPTVQRMR